MGELRTIAPVPDPPSDLDWRILLEEAAMACFAALYEWLPALLGAPSPGPEAGGLDSLLGPASTLNAILDYAVQCCGGTPCRARRAR
jgi:hypothetical protein